MPPPLATLVFVLGILGLFLLDRDRKAQTSIALWLPIAWLVLGGSRQVSVWLGASAFTQSADQYLEGSPMDRAILSGLITVGLLVLGARAQRTGEAMRRNVPLLVVLLYCAASTLWSDFPFVALKRYTKALGNVVMVLIVLTDPDPRSALKKFLTRTAFLLVPPSILLIKFYPVLGRYYDRWEGTQFYSGVATDKNMLGCISLVLGLGTLLRFVETFRKAPHRFRRLLAVGTLFAMNLWLLSVANSATALGCFIVGGTLIVVFSQVGQGRTWMVHLTVGVIAVVAISTYVFPDAYSFLVGSMGRNTTLTGRTDLWSDLLQMDNHPWFGAGFESFFLGDRLELLWAKYWWHPNEAHNGYLETYLTLGIVGLCLLAVLIVTGYRNAINAYRSDPLSGSLRLAIVVIAPIYNLTEAAFKIMNPVWILFLLAVTAVPDSQRQEEEQKDVSVSESSRRVPVEAYATSGISRARTASCRSAVEDLAGLESVTDRAAMST
ncbi:MAG: hypothetical protein DMF91_09785 [Acidobacteria bacterium]|nr:MAG: hypothetical protein DMF91_09785 [Acidobacteriota bacterium]